MLAIERPLILAAVSPWNKGSWKRVTGKVNSLQRKTALSTNTFQASKRNFKHLLQESRNAAEKKLPLLRKVKNWKGTTWASEKQPSCRGMTRVDSTQLPHLVYESLLGCFEHPHFHIFRPTLQRPIQEGVLCSQDCHFWFLRQKKAVWMMKKAELFNGYFLMNS